MGCKSSSEAGGQVKKAQPPALTPAEKHPPNEVKTPTPAISPEDIKVGIQNQNTEFQNLPTSQPQPTRTLMGQRTCEKEWCKKTFNTKDFAAHLIECEKNKPIVCFKCGVAFVQKDIKVHSAGCNPQRCQHCQHDVIPRLLKYCPLSLHSTKLNRKIPVYDVKQILTRHCRKFTDKKVIAASKIKHWFKFLKMRSTFTDIVFRVILREMELARESLIVGHKQVPENQQPQAPVKKKSTITTKCAYQDIPTNHYFPRDPMTPITMNIISQMMEDLSVGNRLPYAAAWRICDEALGILQSRRNVQHITPPEGARNFEGRWAIGGKIVVVGDLHGQFHDLLHILKENGLPDVNKGTSYVFNGDFVDRGANSVEILLLLYGMLVACPQAVYLNRGNHEVFYMNEDYGFDVEVTTKYDRQMYHLMQRTFNGLPLATCVSRRVLIIHGGIPRHPGATLDFMDTINRFRPMPMPEAGQSEGDVAFQDILWSDPWDLQGIGMNERGAGVMFGKDITERFLENNHLSLIIRSHEPFLKGYEEHHDGKVVTIFSASNYDGEDSNKASYAVITSTRPEMPSYHTYRARDMHDITLNAGLNNSSFGHTIIHSTSAVEEVLRHIRERIYIKRHQLLKFFNSIDVTKRGTVWKVEWVEAMRTVLSMEVPWFFLRMYLADADPVTCRINYTQFLWRYQNKLMIKYTRQLEKIVVDKFCYALQQNRAQVAAELDRSDSKVTFGDFEKLLHSSLDIGLRDEEVFILFTFLDKNFDGFVPANRMLSYMDAPQAQANKEKLWELEVMQELQNLFISGRMSLEHAFRAMNHQGNVALDIDQFIKGMTMLNRALRTPLQPNQMRELFDMVDVDKDGQVSFADFVDSFSVHDAVYEAQAIRGATWGGGSFIFTPEQMQGH
eukprot:PhF_6_TR37544/c1_g1_i1/m.55608